MHTRRYDEAKQLLRGTAQLGMEARDPAGRTPLMLASAGSHGRLVKLLLRKGASVNVQDAAGCTPLHHALAAGPQPHVGVARLLLAAGADPLVCSAAGLSCQAMWAAAALPGTP